MINPCGHEGGARNAPQSFRPHLCCKKTALDVVILQHHNLRTAVSTQGRPVMPHPRSLGERSHSGSGLVPPDLLREPDHQVWVIAAVVIGCSRALALTLDGLHASR